MPQSAPGNVWIAGVDVGGTFSDVFLFNTHSGECRIAKVASKRDDPSQAIIAGLRTADRAPKELAAIVHGTTVGTNALLERSGARTGLITTQGFRDVLEMRRRDRPTTWGLWGSYEPIVARDRRLEVAERTLADGRITTPLDESALQAAVTTLLDEGVEAVAIAFINSYANPHNEQAALAQLQSLWPNDFITVASDLLPEIREFERLSTTLLNAYLQPPVGRYLQRLKERLANGGFTGQTLIVQSNGGLMSLDDAAQMPIKTALSGPAAGVTASAYLAHSAGYSNVITCDMGGTSFDVALIQKSRTAIAAQTALDFGLIIRTPMVEMTTIGAGGGSIAHIDRGGLLQIGPESAGSNPGPVCYGLLNDRPTVTDANLVLGRINPDKPIGGSVRRLEIDAAVAAITQQIGIPLGLEPIAAAEAIIKVADSRMAGAVRLVSIERGHDPARFVAMTFGGGGALHASALLRELGLSGVLVPRYPGIHSALGCVIADMRHDFVQTINRLLNELNLDQFHTQIDTLARRGISALERSATDFVSTELLIECEMAYLGQTHALNVALGRYRDGQKLNLAKIQQAFVDHYEKTYGRSLQDAGIPIRVLNLRIAAIGQRPKFDLSALAPQGGARTPEAIAERLVRIDGRNHCTPIYDRNQLAVGSTIHGPALIEQTDATVFIEPNLHAIVDDFGSLLIRAALRTPHEQYHSTR